MKTILKNINNWNNEIKNLNLFQSLNFVIDNLKGKKIFSTSFSIEDQIITYALNELNKEILIFTLDTGRLFNETYNTFQQTQEKYKNLKIKTLFPLENQINNYILKNGINGFYNSVKQRKECCKIRKVIPLNRALQDAKLWITGIRSEHSISRKKNNFLEYDKLHNLIKFHPIIKWTLEEVENYIKKHTIPIISLYKKGFKSIGCAPCTRKIDIGEDFRAGRWWWENSNHKECGLHQ